MDTRKVHQLLLLALTCCVVITVFLLLLEPMVGVLTGLVSALGFVWWTRAKPQLYRAEKTLWREGMGRLRHRLQGESMEPGPAPVRYELVMVRPNTGQVFPLDQKDATVGRGPECTCRLAPGFASVGRVHCRILYREHSREYYIEDLRSMNGTYLGTKRLDPNTQVKLLAGTEIIIGDVALRFQCAAAGRQG